MDTDFDALVVGGAAAGLSAALVLGRARVRTLVVDAGEPSNRTARRDRRLARPGRHEPARALRRRPRAARFAAGGRAALGPRDSDRAGRRRRRRASLPGATLGDGGAVAARRVLLAGGMRYAVPDTPGLAELWGGAAFVCPYCHGWEHRDRRIGILGATGAAHRVALLRSWSDDLVVLADGELAPDDRDALRAAGVPTTEQPVAAVVPGLVCFVDGDELAVDALHVLAPMAPRDDLAAQLGIADDRARQRHGHRRRRHVRRDLRPGVFAAGDAAGAGNVAAAIAGGSLAATGLHRSLVLEQVH